MPNTINKKKSLLWGISFAFLFIIFYGIIPLDIYSKYTTFITILGTLLCTGTLLAFVISAFYGTPPDEEPVNDENDYSGYVFGAIIIGGLIGFGILFISNEVRRESAELRKNGVYTTAKVIDGSSYSTRKADFTSLDILFLDEQKNTKQTSISVSKHEFHNFYKMQNLRIVYSRRYPDIIRRVSEEEYRKNIRK